MSTLKSMDTVATRIIDLKIAREVARILYRRKLTGSIVRPASLEKLLLTNYDLEVHLLSDLSSTSGKKIRMIHSRLSHHRSWKTNTRIITCLMDQMQM